MPLAFYLAISAEAELRRLEERLEVERFESDGGKPLTRVTTCTGCGTTEEDSACFCYMTYGLR
jgi:hypothetical protein